MVIEQILPSGEKLKLLSSGKKFFDELERLIDAAKEEIHFQVYIFEPDETGSRVANALLRAALRGVKIFLLIDAYGSGNFPDELIEQLRKAGAGIKRYGPFLKRGRFHLGRRLHRKVMVFDMKTAIVAGINISNNYNDIHGKKAWLDFGVLAEGNIVQKLHSICLQRWIKKPLRGLPKRKATGNDKNISTSIFVKQNDWIHGLNEAHESYVREIKQAQSSILIVGGYFLPGGRMRNLLRHAAERGVKVRVILAEESDVALQRNAVKYLYRWMLNHGIEIYEYLPSNVHGKVLIADKKITLIGSYDLNNLSTYSNIELNLDIHQEALSLAFENELESIVRNDCRLVTMEELSRMTNPWRRFINWLSYRTVKSFFVMASWVARADEDEYQ